MKRKTKEPVIETPSLLVLHEKHGRGYFHIPNKESLHAISLEIVTKRLKSGDWYYEPTLPKPPGMSFEQVQSLPWSDIRETALRAVKQYEVAWAQYLRDLDDFIKIQKIAKDKDGKEAWVLLNRRSGAGYEYERVELTPYNTRYWV